MHYNIISMKKKMHELSEYNGNYIIILYIYTNILYIIESYIINLPSCKCIHIIILVTISSVFERHTILYKYSLWKTIISNRVRVIIKYIIVDDKIKKYCFFSLTYPIESFQIIYCFFFHEYTYIIQNAVRVNFYDSIENVSKNFIHSNNTKFELNPLFIRY